jgi:ribosomal protein S6
MAEELRPEGQSQATDEKAVYEVGFHVVSSLAEGEVGAVVEKLRAVLKKAEAEIIAEGAPQKMALAYQIERPVSGGKREKHDSSYFGWIKFETAPQSISTIETFLRNTHEILRYLLIGTVREDITSQPRRAVFTSDRLEGKTIEKRPSQPEKKGEVSEEELDKSIEALVS